MSISYSAASHRYGEAASTRELADLARSGYAGLSQPLMQVRFEVHHVSDKPGYLMGYLMRAQPDDDPELNFGETLTSSANGQGVVVVTRADLGMGAPRQYQSGGLMRCEVSDEEGVRIFRGTARPNPNFIDESAWKFEGLICIDPNRADIQVWHCRAIRDVIYAVAKIAQEANSPILSLQAPVQVPPSRDMMRLISSDREEDLLTSAASVAVRFSIAVQDPDAETRLKLSTRIQDFCRRHGFGLWLADTRLGRRPGNWFGIRDCDARLSKATPPSQPSNGRYVRRLLPITLVGPARIGAAHSLVSFLSQFDDIGVAACSVTSLDDLLLLHLQISIANVFNEVMDKIDGSIDATAEPVMLPPNSLTSLMETLGRDRPTDLDRRSLLIRDVGDYQCLVGPSRVVPRGTARDRSARDRIAIWFSWQTQGADMNLATPLKGLYEAFTDSGLLSEDENGIQWHSGAPSIEYLICRNMGNSVLRGKGKLSVIRSTLDRYPYDALDSRPTNMCVGIEESWRARSARDGQAAIRELTVAWRECWLGHWSLPL